MNWSLASFGFKPFRMVWRVTKDAQTSFLAGTAHFYPYSCARSLKRLIRQVDVVLTEGPLDDLSLTEIAERGRDGGGCADLAARLGPDVVRRINRILADRLSSSDGNDWMLLPSSQPDYFNLFTRDARPWMALFSIWTTYLNWDHSVDLEAYRIALRLGKRVAALETIEEQLAVLEGIPIERVLSHLGKVESWDAYRDDYVRHYSAGELDALVSTTDRFPTRTPGTIAERDRVMFQRLQPFFEQTPTAAFIGFPHLPGVIQLFEFARLHCRTGIRMITPQQRLWIESHAFIPEHLPVYVTSIAPSEPFLVEDYLVYLQREALIFIGYPLDSQPDEARLSAALEHCLSALHPSLISMIAPSIPKAIVTLSLPQTNIAPSIPQSIMGSDPPAITQDAYYRLDLADLQLSKKLRSLLKRAGRDLTIEYTQTWTKELQRLVDAFKRSHRPDREPQPHPRQAPVLRPLGCAACFPGP